MTPDLTKLAADIHADNVTAGWWDNKGTLVTKMMLVVTELSEAVEGDRKSLMDDHLPHHPMAHVELADAMIRLLDIMGRDGMKHTALPPDLKGRLLDCLIDLSFPEMIFATTSQLCASQATLAARAGGAIENIILIADICDFDIWSIVDEKRKYNLTRADHKRDERAKKHGKKY